jgi:hypothetical protein
MHGAVFWFAAVGLAEGLFGAGWAAIRLLFSYMCRAHVLYRGNQGLGTDVVNTRYSGI